MSSTVRVSIVLIVIKKPVDYEIGISLKGPTGL